MNPAENPVFTRLDFTSDFEGLARLASGEGTFTLGAVLIVGLGLIYLIRLCCGVLRDWLPENSGLFSRLQMVGVTLVSALVVYVWFRRFLYVAPLITIAASGVMFLVVLISQMHLIGDLVAGAILLIRSNLAAGAQVSVGKERGLVERMGSLAVVLKTAEGERLFVPNRVILSEAVAVQSSSRTVPVTVIMPLEGRVPEDFRHQLFRAGVLCPYRQPGSPVSVTGQGGSCEVSFGVPDEAHRTLAERFLQRTLRRAEEPQLHTSSQVIISSNLR